MNKFKNLKIAITPEHPLDEVVKELERIGYNCWAWTNNCIGWIFTWDDGDYTNTEDLDDIDHQFHETTTLTQLKEME